MGLSAAAPLVVSWRCALSQGSGVAVVAGSVAGVVRVTGPLQGPAPRGRTHLPPQKDWSGSSGGVLAAYGAPSSKGLNLSGRLSYGSSSSSRPSPTGTATATVPDGAKATATGPGGKGASGSISTRSSAPDLKPATASFNSPRTSAGSGNALLQNARALGAAASALASPSGGSRARTLSSSGPNNSAPAVHQQLAALDLGAALTRRTAAATFQTNQPRTGLTSVSSLPTPSVRSQRPPGSGPPEGMFVLDDITFTYGHASIQGSRDYQEDTVAVLHTPASLLAGVFDGHGGDEVSKELERVLLTNINRRVSEAVARHPDDVRAIEAALHAAYVGTNEEMAARMERAREAGSCSVTLLVRHVAGRPMLFVANAGDCRAVLCFAGASASSRRVTRLSEDHKPHPSVNPAEIARVCDAGGSVLWGRVQGCLAVSRAFGDRTLAPYVIADPHIETRALEPERDLFIYLASDGVTDIVDDAQGCNLLADQFARGATCTAAAQSLVNAAYHRGSCDNISALVVRMRRRAPGDAPFLGATVMPGSSTVPGAG